MHGARVLLRKPGEDDPASLTVRFVFRVNAYPSNKPLTKKAVKVFKFVLAGHLGFTGKLGRGRVQSPSGNCSERALQSNMKPLDVAVSSEKAPNVTQDWIINL